MGPKFAHQGCRRPTDQHLAAILEPEPQSQMIAEVHGLDESGRQRSRLHIRAGPVQEGGGDPVRTHAHDAKHPLEQRFAGFRLHLSAAAQTDDSDALVKAGDPAREQVCITDASRDHRIRRIVEKRRGGANLVKATCLQNPDLVAQQKCFVTIARRQQDGEAARADQATDRALQGLARDGCKPPERVIEQEQSRLKDQRACDGSPDAAGRIQR